MLPVYIRPVMGSNSCFANMFHCIWSSQCLQAACQCEPCSLHCNSTSAQLHLDFPFNPQDPVSMCSGCDSACFDASSVQHACMFCDATVSRHAHTTSHAIFSMPCTAHQAQSYQTPHCGSMKAAVLCRHVLSQRMMRMMSYSQWP